MRDDSINVKKQYQLLKDRETEMHWEYDHRSGHMSNIVERIKNIDKQIKEFEEIYPEVLV